MGSSLSSIVFPAPKPTYDESWENYVELVIPGEIGSLSSTSDSVVGAFYFPCAGSSKAMIYSHGNSVDIGQLWGLFKSLSEALKVNVLCYDYVGYGVNTDAASEQGCIKSINAALKFLKNKDFSEKNILLYGRSIGTGPTVHLGAELCVRGIPPLAVVLESPYTSVFKVASKYIATGSSFVDMFKNENKIHLITAPIIIFHGKLIVHSYIRTLVHSYTDSFSIRNK